MLALDFLLKRKEQLAQQKLQAEATVWAVSGAIQENDYLIEEARRAAVIKSDEGVRSPSLEGELV